jgi:peptide/nickel transport system substrate-binding protein
MEEHMRKSSLLALVGAFAVVAALVIGPAASAKPTRVTAGTVVIIHDQEPPTLRGSWEDNNLLATSLVTNNIWYGCEIYNANATFTPRLCTSKPKIVKRSPLTIRFTYKASAVWSDGSPVTAKDYRATWKVFTNPHNNVVSRTGWEDIRSVIGNGKTVTVVWKKPFADWESYVASGPYQAKAIAGKDMNQTFENSIPVSSGPWKFQSWQKGVQITLVKNTRFHAWKPMNFTRVVFRYVLDTNARFQALKAGEGQAMQSQPQLQIADFLKDRKFVVIRKPDIAYEHVDLQFGPQGHPALKKAFVRRALTTGINRQQIADALYRTIAPGLPALNSLIYKPFEAGYANFWGKTYPFNQARVINILKSNGCTGGPDRASASNNDIFSCPGVGKLSFRFFTTTGNQLRALAFEIMQRQLKSVGIDLDARFQTGGVLFGTTLPSSDWDLIMFTYGQTPTSKITAKDLYSCGGDQNYGLYCNKKATALLNKVPLTLSAAQRVNLLHQAESKYIVKDVPSIPLYSRPAFTIHSTSLHGPVVNPTTEGMPWNISDWTS